MSKFDLSVLELLQNKFTELENQISDRENEISEQEKELAVIVKKIQDFESQKMSLELKINETKEQSHKLKQLHQETTSQYSIVKDSANQLLTLFE